jgi:outer membrane protein
MQMYEAECMNLSKPACWVFSGLMLAASDVNAQEAGQNMRQSSESEIHLPAGIDAYEKPLRDAETLMKDGKPAEAYKLLEPLEFERSGEIRFDYLIGIAALDSGKPDKATLAFERVLAEDPEYAGARLEMARAYYQLGDISRARAEFEAVLKQNPSKGARATIQKYLDNIDEKETGKRTHISGYVEGTIGRDTNVNNASELTDNIITPTMNPDNAELADNYFAIGAGAEINHSMDANWLLYAGADLSEHNNHRQKYYDPLDLEERIGVIYGTRTDRYRVGMLGGQKAMGNVRYRNNAGINAEWRHAVGASNQLNVFGQYMQYRFADTAMKLNDINQQVAGAGWLHVFGDKKSTLSGSMYFGTEDDVGPVTMTNPDGGRTDGAKRLGGFRIGGQTVGKSVKLYFSGGEQYGKFEEINPTISGQRTDRLDDLTLGANWYVNKQWTVRTQVTRFINMSNVDAYAYDRTDYSLTIRRNFK